MYGYCIYHNFALTKLGHKHSKLTMSGLRPEQATSEHCYYVFAVLDAHLTGKSVPEPQFPDVSTALFVTWNKHGTFGESRLRGCIGTLSPRMVHSGLRDYALTSALRDTRFSPISAKELPQLSCKVCGTTRVQHLHGRHWTLPKSD